MQKAWVLRGGKKDKATFSVCIFLLIGADVELLYDMGVDSSLCCVDPCVLLGPLGGLNFVSATRCIGTTAETKAPFFPP